MAKRHAFRALCETQALETCSVKGCDNPSAISYRPMSNAKGAGKKFCAKHIRPESRKPNDNGFGALPRR